MSTKANQATMLGELSSLGRAALIANLGTSRSRKMVLAFLATMLIIHVASWWETRQQLQAGYQDFTIFYTAGKILSQGQGAQLYDNALQYRIQQEFAPHVSIRHGPMPYNHLPVEAALFVPFARLPYFTAYVLWDLLNLALLALTIRVLRPHLSAFGAQPPSFWVLVTLGFFPVFLALLQGQDILLLLLLYALAYSAMRKQSNAVAGCWLGLGLFRFHLVLPFILLATLQKKWRVLAGFAVTAMLIALLSLAVVGWNETLAYPVYLLRVENTLGTGVIAPENMPNLRGLLHTLLHAASPPVFLFALIAITSAALIWITLKLSQVGNAERLFPLHFSLALIMALLVSYHEYDYELSLLLLPVLLIANHFQVYSMTQDSRWQVLAPMFLLFLTPLHMVLLFQWRLACILAVVLLAWFWGISREILRHANHANARLQPAP